MNIDIIIIMLLFVFGILSFIYALGAHCGPKIYSFGIFTYRSYGVAHNKKNFFLLISKHCSLNKKGLGGALKPLKGTKYPCTIRFEIKGGDRVATGGGLLGTPRYREPFASILKFYYILKGVDKISYIKGFYNAYGLHCDSIDWENKNNTKVKCDKTDECSYSDCAHHGIHDLVEECIDEVCQEFDSCIEPGDLIIRKCIPI